MKAMILAAGFGKRLLPITETIPKPLLTVGNKSLIQRNIQLLIESGVSEIIINVSHLGDLVKKHIDEIFPSENILFSFEEKPLGTGGGILKALPLIGNDCFLLMNADILHKIDVSNVPKDVKAAHLIGVSNPDHNLNGDFNLVNGLIDIDSESNSYTWSGISVMNPKIFENNSFKKDHFNIWSSVLPKYIEEGIVTGHASSKFWLDVGTIERLKLANTVYNDEN